MTNIELVKELRNRTQAKLNDCKLAIEQSGGNIDLAIEFLQKKGQADSIKRRGNIGTEGIVWTMCLNGLGVILEVNIETDFAAKNPEFRVFVDELLVQLLDADKDEDISNMNLIGHSETIEETRVSLV